MKVKKYNFTWLPALSAVFMVLALSLWLTRVRGTYHPPRLSGEDKTPESVRSAVGKKVEVIRATPEGALLETGGGKASSVEGSWPCFRGADRDAVSKEDYPLARSWPGGGPPVLWELELGQGYAGAAIDSGRVYVFDFDEEQQRDLIRCLSLDDGKDIWKYSYPMETKRNHGISRTVPDITGGYLTAISPKCHVTCLDAETGEFKWRLDPVSQMGTKVPGWYAGQCPYVDRGRLIFAPGGTDILIMAIELDTGEIAWTTPNIHDSAMSHASVVPMEFNGTEMYIYAGNKGVVAVSPEDGEILWETTEFKWHTVAPSPLPIGDGRIVFTAGYACRAALIQLKEEDGKIVPELIKKTSPREFGAEQHTPIYYGANIYCVIPKPRQELICADRDLNEIWASGSSNKFGIGPYMIADGLILLMDDVGVLTMAEATAQGYKQLGQAEIFEDGHDSWGPFALVKGRLIVRDMYKMKCLDIGKK